MALVCNIDLQKWFLKRVPRGGLLSDRPWGTQPALRCEGPGRDMIICLAIPEACSCPSWLMDPDKPSPVPLSLWMLSESWVYWTWELQPVFLSQAVAKKSLDFSWDRTVEWLSLFDGFFILSTLDPAQPWFSGQSPGLWGNPITKTIS